MNKNSLENFESCIVDFNKLMLDTLSLMPENQGSVEQSEPMTIVNNYVKVRGQNKPYDMEPSFTFTRLALHNDQFDLVIDFTISFDINFEIPVLYFRVFEQETDEEFEELRPIRSLDYLYSRYKYLLGTPESIKSNISLEFNPSMSDQANWYFLHPCETQETLYNIHENSFANSCIDRDSGVHFLSTWFGICGLSAIFRKIAFRPHILNNSYR